MKESASMEITRIAKSYSLQGYKVFTLSIGDTHFGLPDPIKLRLNKAIEENKTHYLDSMGLPALRKDISRFEFQEAYLQDEILIVPGVKQGLFYFLEAFEGKKIAILEPAWLGYHSICKMTGKEIIPINIKKEGWLEKLASISFDALLVCTPNNPDGTVFSESEIKQLASYCDKNQACLIIDEIYAEYSFDHSVKTMLKPYYSQENVVVMNGFSKAYAATGLRIGYVATHNPVWNKRMNAVHQNTATCANSLAQFAFLNYHESHSIVQKYASYYRENRDLVCEIIPELEEMKPQGGFYFFIDLNRFGISDAEEFSRRILTDIKIALVPGSAYGTGFDSYVRLSYSLDRDELREGIQLLKKYLQDYESE